MLVNAVVFSKNLLLSTKKPMPIVFIRPWLTTNVQIYILVNTVGYKKFQQL
jgi:hypothetical protein